MLEKLEFDFELGEPIVTQIRLLDKVLSELNVAELNENPDFIFNRESAGTFSLRCQLSPSDKNTVNMHLFFEGDGLRIDIDGIPEAFEWSIKQLQKSENEVVNFIKELFTSHILMEYYPSRTTMSFFDSNGVRTDKFVLRRYFSFAGIFRKEPEQSIYFPIYKL